MWLFEERFGGYEEERRAIGCTILTEDGSAELLAGALEPLMGASRSTLPTRVGRPHPGGRNAVGQSILLLELMGEFVNADLLSIMDIHRTVARDIPRNNDGPETSSQTEPDDQN